KNVHDLIRQMKEMQSKDQSESVDHVQFPPVGQIRKIVAQFWDNKAEPVARRDNKRSNIPNFLLKLHVWTIGANASLVEGDCGDYWMPLFIPGTAYSRLEIVQSIIPPDYMAVWSPPCTPERSSQIRRQ